MHQKIKDHTYFVTSMLKCFLELNAVLWFLLKMHCPIPSDMFINVQAETWAVDICFHFWCPVNIVRWWFNVVCVCLLWCCLGTRNYVQILCWLNRNFIFILGLIVRNVFCILNNAVIVFELYNKILWLVLYVLCYLHL